MTRRRRVLAVLAVVGLGLAGCGIPGETGARIDGSGPPPGLATGTATSGVPPARDAATTREQFVDNYLMAAAGEPDGAPVRVRDYLTPSAGADVKEQPEEPSLSLVKVVERTVASQPDGSAVATVRVQQVGILLPNGRVDPPELTTAEYQLPITTMENKRGWFIDAAPTDGLLLNVDALADYYETQALYFWNREGTGLVPDLRYMPTAVSLGGQPTEIVGRLLTGPSPLIAPVVRSLEGITLIGTVPDTGARLVISLSAEAAAEEYDPGALGRQILWSLPQAVRKPLTLKIQGQPDFPVEVDDAYRAANPAGGLAEMPQRFAIYKGKVHRLDSSPNGGDPLPPLLADQVNHDLAAAALASEPETTAAALVMGAPGTQRLLVGAIREGDTTMPTSVDGKQHPQITRPAWLKAPLDTGLVVIGGVLYRFGLSGGGLTAVSLPRGLTGQVSNVSAAPDGRRIALVVDGRLYVAAMNRADGSVDLASAQAVRTSLRPVADAAWSAEGQLVVAGVKGNKSVIVTIRIDSIDERDQEAEPGTAVTYLVAYPRNPLALPERPKLMYVAGGIGYDVVGNDSLIEAGEVVGAPADVPAGAAGAPFFLN